MNRLPILVALALSTLLGVAVSGTALAEPAMQTTVRVYEASLTGPNEVPPTTSPGVGAAGLELSLDGNTLFYSLEVHGASSTVSAGHIHLGAPGQNGDVVVNLCGAGSAPACGTEGEVASGSVTASDLTGPLKGHPLSDLMAALMSGSTYVNVHTANNPGGEIRGQVQPVGTTVTEPATNQQDNTSQDDGEQNQHDANHD